MYRLKGLCISSLLCCVGPIASSKICLDLRLFNMSTQSRAYLLIIHGRDRMLMLDSDHIPYHSLSDRDVVNKCAHN